MRMDITCPIELVEWELLRDDREHARAYIKLRCLAASPVRSMAGVVRFIDAQAPLAERRDFDAPFEAENMSLSPGACLKIPVSAGYLPRSVRLEVFFTRVESGEGEWTGGEETLREYPDPPRLPARLSNALAADAGGDAICCAQSREEGGWLCVCGRENAKGAENCVRCGRNRSETCEKYSPEAVERLAMQASGPFQSYSAPFGDEEMPETRVGSASGREAERPRAEGRLRALLITLLLAAALACAALGVRTARYRETNAAGLMPTSNAGRIETGV